MKPELSKILYELSEDSRITTKKLGKSTKKSQQAASYVLKSLEDKKLIKGYVSIIDPSRLGLLNVYVLYNFVNLKSERIKSLKQYIKANPWIISAETVSMGADILVEYSVGNLSFFNKKHKAFLHEFKEILQTLAVYVIIVKHLYGRKYLSKKSIQNEVIICGDRPNYDLSSFENKVLHMLDLNARVPLRKVGEELLASPQRVLSTKKKLEREKIVLKYSVWLNHAALGIKRTLLFIKPSSDDPDAIKKLLFFTRQHGHIVEATKIIGAYDILLVIEGLERQADVITDIRKRYGIAKYKTILSEEVFKRGYLPDMP